MRRGSGPSSAPGSIAKLDGEAQRAPRISHPSVWRMMSNKYVLIMALVYAGASGASTSLALWMPQLVKSFGLTNWQTGLVNAVPFGIAAVWMILWGRSSDRTRRAGMAQRPAAGLDGARHGGDILRHPQPVGHDPAADPDRRRHLRQQGSVLGDLSSEWLGAASAAAGLAQINALGNLSSFFFNYLIGWIQAETGSFPLALMPIALTAAIGTICVLVIGHRHPRTAV